MDSEFREAVRSGFQELHESDGTGEFEFGYQISESPEAILTVNGERLDSDRWGENSYATDANIRVSTDSRESMEEIVGEVSDVEEGIREILEETIGYTGPVILRANDDPSVIAWARRVIHEEEETEE